METIQKIRVGILAIVVVALIAALIPGVALAQDFRNPNGNRNGNPLFGILPGTGNGFIPPIPGPNLNDPGTANLIGSFLGSFLGTVVVNNQNNRDYGRDHYYDHRYPDRDRNYGRDYRYYGPNNRGYNSWPYSEYGR